MDHPHLTAALSAPALLWVGHTTTLRTQAEHLFQTIFCSHAGCGTCSTCLQIVAHQHHAIRWFMPEKQYLVEHIDTLLESMTLTLETGHHAFLVLERAETLTPATANRLLKSLEAPPPRYH